MAEVATTEVMAEGTAEVTIVEEVTVGAMAPSAATAGTEVTPVDMDMAAIPLTTAMEDTQDIPIPDTSVILPITAMVAITATATTITTMMGGSRSGRAFWGSFSAQSPRNGRLHRLHLMVIPPKVPRLKRHRPLRPRDARTVHRSRWAAIARRRRPPCSNHAASGADCQVRAQAALVSCRPFRRRLAASSCEVGPVSFRPVAGIRTHVEIRSRPGNLHATYTQGTCVGTCPYRVRNETGSLRSLRRNGEPQCQIQTKEPDDGPAGIISLESPSSSWACWH